MNGMPTIFDPYSSVVGQGSGTEPASCAVTFMLTIRKMPQSRQPRAPLDQEDEVGKVEMLRHLPASGAAPRAAWPQTYSVHPG